ncbi:MAG TPA: TauD/TfdA family dioxygenase [Spongiibacteraceae bacterium]|nr:TauD/TfdA family dioxygenase [Spongiibacteraceae bacterium]
MTKSSASFPLRQLVPFGLELEIDLRKPLSAEEQREFRDLFYKNSLFVFRNQKLSMEDHECVLGYLGNVLKAKGEYRMISTDGNLGAGALAYHSDLSFTEQPFKVISLHALEVNDGQTYTNYVNSIRALEHLPQRLHEKLAGSTALACINVHQSERQLPFNPPSMLPQITRPAIIPHPETSAPVLYISELQTTRIDGYSQPESDALINELFKYLYAADNIYEHRWYNGDLVIWDNIALQHARPDMTGCIPRVLQRVCVADKTFFELCPQFDLEDPRVKKWAAGEPLAI